MKIMRLCGITVAAALLLLVHMAYYYPFTPDDTFISLRYAQRFVEGLGLTWNDGEYVEGYSNLLWVLLAAALHYAGMDLLTAVRLLGTASTFMTLGVFYVYARRTKLPAGAFAGGMSAFALAAPVAIWAASGMETPLVMLLFAAAVLPCRTLLERESAAAAVKAGCLLGLICGLRPEGPVYTVIAALGLLMCSAVPMRRRVRMTAIMCFIPLMFFCALLAFRLSYYGAWVPNTVLAKVAFNALRFFGGITYAAKAILSFLPPLLLIRYAYKKYRPQMAENAWRFSRFLMMVCILLSLSIAVAGGDWMVGNRAFLPLVPLVALLVMEACRLLVFNGREKALTLAALVFYVLIQFMDKDNLNANMAKNWVPETVQAIGLELKKRYGEKPLIAVYTAGAIPYYSQLPSLDVYGLNDAYLTSHRHALKTFGRGLAGHELFDPDYVKSRTPDILLFDIPGIKPLCSVQDCESLLTDYERRSLPIPGYDVAIWVRKGSAKVKP